MINLPNALATLPGGWPESEGMGVEVFNSGTIITIPGGQDYSIKWTNGSVPIWITDVYILILNDIQCVMDTWAKLKISDQLISKVVWDKYANPADTHGQWHQLSDDHYIPQQGNVKFQFMAKPIGRLMGAPTAQWPDAIDYSVLNFGVTFGCDFRFRYA